MEIKDSGARREFASGAVRDIQEGKGRCDLLPLDIVGELLIYYTELEDQSCSDTDKNVFINKILKAIDHFIRTGNKENIYFVIRSFSWLAFKNVYDAILQVSKHYEDGAKKYAERNWEKGISCHCYVDSGVRHLLKWLDGWNDEPHDRAFLWNMLGLLWTVKHKPECNDLPYMQENAVKEASEAEDAEWGTVEERMELLRRENVIR